MEFLVKIFLIIIPLMIISVGVFLVYQAGDFWLDTIGPSLILDQNIAFDQSLPFDTKVYYPARIQPQELSQSIEIEIAQSDFDGKIPEQASFELTEECDYLSLEKSQVQFEITDESDQVQNELFGIRIRNTIPPTKCKFTISGQTEATNSSASIEIDIPINAWTGHMISIGEALIGLVVAFLGSRGLLAAFEF